MTELGPKARAVVEAGRAADDPTGHDRARIRAALTAAIAAGSAGAATVAGEGAASAGAAKAGAAGAVALGWGWKALVVGLAVASAVGVGVGVTRTPAMAPRGAPSVQGFAAPTAYAPAGPTEPVPSISAEDPSLDPPPRSRAPAPGAGDALVAPVRPPAQQSAAPHGPSARDPAPAVSAAPSGSEVARPEGSVPAAVAPRPADSLAAEIRALGEARGAMQGGDPAKALVLLDEQSAAYASGQLREERTAARVLALCKLGKRDEARALAARFLADNPRSPLADRVRGACAAGDPR